MRELCVTCVRAICFPHGPRGMGQCSMYDSARVHQKKVWKSMKVEYLFLLSFLQLYVAAHPQRQIAAAGACQDVLSLE